MPSQLDRWKAELEDDKEKVMKQLGGLQTYAPHVTDAVRPLMDDHMARCRRRAGLIDTAVGALDSLAADGHPDMESLQNDELRQELVKMHEDMGEALQHFGGGSPKRGSSEEPSSPARGSRGKD